MHQINKSVTALSYLQITQISAILLYSLSNDLLYPRLEAKARVFASVSVHGHAPTQELYYYTSK